jgi:hypothetical protein
MALRCYIFTLGAALRPYPWEQVFDADYDERKPKPGYISDTGAEARELMPFLASAPGESRATMGKGEIVFQWFGEKPKNTGLWKWPSTLTTARIIPREMLLGAWDQEFVCEVAPTQDFFDENWHYGGTSHSEETRRKDDVNTNDLYE